MQLQKSWQKVVSVQSLYCKLPTDDCKLCFANYNRRFFVCWLDYCLCFQKYCLLNIRQEMSMAETPEKNEAGKSAPEKGNNWGPKLFIGVLAAILVFFYWLLIYSGGVTVHHG